VFASRIRRPKDLRRGRVSEADARYFVTFCTAGRKPILSSEVIRGAFVAANRQVLQDGDVCALTGTLMPEHVHLLFTLGHRLSLSRVVAKWRAFLRRADLHVSWQPNYFDHRLHPSESAEGYAWYIFMNPYHAGLLPIDQTWLGWWTDGAVPYSFLASAGPGPTPRSEWMGDVERIAARLVTGAD
jgi:putative transposase